MPAAPVIDVTDLTKRFGDLLAVDRVSFALAPGEILGLLGANGAGKTTTLQLVLGLTAPTSGRIRVLGMDIEKKRRAVLQRVNFSSAYISLPTNLTAWENLLVFSRLYGLRRARAKILGLLERFEIPHVLNRVVGSLSSGQITRLNLCKALLNDPEVLFLDEPTASLDPDIAEKVRCTLLDIQHERHLSIIWTSHNMQEITNLCDRVIFLARGRVVLEGGPQEILDRTRADSLDEVFISVARSGNLHLPAVEATAPASAGIP
ncbi:MAG: ABC transporter ATP-binding protein [Pirellulales bacterium]|nr:ABC transporter ATP-binding protein [Pirellulales bacterium]